MRQWLGVVAVAAMVQCVPDKKSDDDLLNLCTYENKGTPLTNP